MKIRQKILVIGVASVLFATLAELGIAYYEATKIVNFAKEQSEKQALDEYDKIVDGVLNLLQAQQEVLQQKINGDLNVARKILSDAGGANLSNRESVEWQAINQYTKQATNITLPAMQAGNTWLGQNQDPGTFSPIVDEVQKLVGGTATVFQRMNDQGDMLRVSTNVIKSDGDRAIGTYIPAINPDGKPNPVLKEVLQGNTFRGRAFVVNKWYITAYEPIRDANDKVIGILYVGVTEESAESLRKEIMDITVGETGYIYVINPQGDYVISKGGSRDGENIWDAKDSDGNLFIQQIVEKAVKLNEGEFGRHEYPWKNPGDPEAKLKTISIGYFEPWQWIIGVGTWNEEFLATSNAIEKANDQGRTILLIVSLIIAALAALIWWFFSAGIANPIVMAAQKLKRVASEGVLEDVDRAQLERKDEIGELFNGIHDLVEFQTGEQQMAHQLAQGNWNTDVPIRSPQDELGKAFSQLVESINGILLTVRDSAEQVDVSSTQISDASQMLSQGATESAASLEEISSSTTELASQTRQNSENAQQANKLSDAARQSASKGNEQMQQMTEAMKDIKDSSEQIRKIIKVIDDIAFQTNLLALNAAVEAARAGQHGKGFAVVAEEVRNLAARSAKAAKETEELIETSGGKVQKGNDIAETTAKSLAEIADSISQASDLVAEIAAASAEQTEGLEQITQGLGQIDSVTQSNTATAEETAASAEELSSQTSELKESLARFKLKDALQGLGGSHGGGSSKVFAEWSNDFSVSVPEMDQEHQKLFDIINELFRAIRGGKATGIQMDILTALSDYTKTHFAHEERLMQSHNYEGLDEQKRLHRKFESKIDDMYKLAQSGASVGLDALNFLKDWLVSHIQKVDGKYASVLGNRKLPGQTPKKEINPRDQIRLDDDFGKY